eukprot:gene40087-61084_t
MRQPLILAAEKPQPTLLAFAENRNVSACAPAVADAPRTKVWGVRITPVWGVRITPVWGVRITPVWGVRITPVWGVGSLLLRRSSDGGRSWAPLCRAGLRRSSDGGRSWAPLCRAGLRRSSDGGRSWAPLQSRAGRRGGSAQGWFDSAKEHVYFTPGLNIDFYSGVYDADRGAVWVMLQEGSSSLFDDWAVPLPAGGGSGGGPTCGHGIQLQRGLCSSVGGCSDAGRLIVPFVCTNSSAGCDERYRCQSSQFNGSCPSCVPCLLLSDDHGGTWRFGAVAQQAPAPWISLQVPAAQQGGRESVVAQAAGPGPRSSLYATERNVGPHPGHRMTARSGDGGETYDPTSLRVDPALPSPVTPHWTGIVASLHPSRRTGPASSRPFTRHAALDRHRRVPSPVTPHWTGIGATWGEGRVLWAGPAGYADVVA